MAAAFNLDQYLERIGWVGATPPTLETLAGLLAAHMLRIPFENLDVLLRRPVRLDLKGLQEKLLRQRRGGYCFEHATLLAAALENLGFQPSRHTARVVLINPRDVSPRTHMFLTVPVDGVRYVLDPGFGALAPQVPVPLADGVEARAGTESHVMARDGPWWTLRSTSGDKAVDCWVSTLDPDNPADFEMGNHYTATHPDSPFRNRIMLRALTGDGRIAVMNRDVTRWRGDEPERWQLADRSALRALLNEHFGFDLPEIAHLRVPSIPEWA